MLNSKKGIIFEGLMFVIVLIILISAFAILTKKSQKFDFQIGERQLNLINTYQRGEKILFYVDQSAKYSMEQAIYDLAEDGGHHELNDCGHYSGLNVWADISIKGSSKEIKKCYPEKDLRESSLKQFFNEKLVVNLANYPDEDIVREYDYGLKEDNSGIQIIGSKYGNAAENRIGLKLKSEGTIGGKEGVDEESKNNNFIASQESNKQLDELYVNLLQRMGINKGYSDCSSGDELYCVTSRSENRDKWPHSAGIALDIRVGVNIKKQLEWIKAADEIGFTGLIVYPCNDRHIHLDIRRQYDETDYGCPIYRKNCIFPPPYNKIYIAVVNGQYHSFPTFNQLKAYVNGVGSCG